MAGRRRRPSNSTVATADDVKPRYLKESKVIRPITAGLEESEEWPEYVLDNATILRKDGVTPASVSDVLNANVKGPLILRGRLDVDLTDPSQRSRLMKPKYKSAEIEIRNSNDKAIGDDPLPVLWMLGNSAWFEINPSPQFKSTYSSVCRAISLYYAMMAIYESLAGHVKLGKRRKMWANFAMEDLFFKYATRIGDGIVLDEVEKLCDEHAQFLLNQFHNTAEFDWEETSFYSWLKARHPKIQQQVLDAAANPKAPAPPSSPDPTSEEDEDIVMEDAPLRKTLSVRGKPAARATSTPDVEPSPRRGRPVQSSPVGEPGDAFSMFQNIVEELGDELEMRRAKVTSINSKIFQRCKMRSYQSMREVTSYFAQQLLDNLSPRWREAPLWEELEDLAANPPANYEMLNPDTLTHQFQRRNRNPNFVPRSEAGRMAAAAAAEAAEESDPPTRKGIKNPRGRPAGKVSSLRPGGSKRRILDDEDEDSGRARKSAKKSHYNIDPEEDEEEDSGSSSDDEPITQAPAPLGGVSASQPPQHVRVVVRAEPIPSMSPKGPNGTWKCEEEGCGYIVRSAEDAEGKELIQAHFDEHARRADRIDLAMEESNRGRQPISHLLEKIRSLGERKKEEEKTFLDSGEQVPQPIKRRLLV